MSVDHVTRDMGVAVHLHGVVGMVFGEVAGLAEPKSKPLAAGLVGLQL